MSVKTKFDAWDTALWLVTILTVLALMSGCGFEHYRSPLGIDITVELGAGDPGAEYVDRAWMLVAATLGGDLGIEPKDKLHVRFVREGFDTCVPDVIAAGCYRGHILEASAVRTSDDPCQTDALAHELVHHWEHMTGREADHDAPWFTDVLPHIEAALYAGCSYDLVRGEHRSD